MSWPALWRFTKLGISILFAGLILTPLSAHSNTIEEILKEAAKNAGLVPVSKLQPNSDKELARIGERLFESRNLGLNKDVACVDCHLDRFSSADGLPLAVGIGGSGEGTDRMSSGGAIVPRNTLALWGVGGPGFETFFWDGKVDFSNGKRISQFGAEPPSTDPLVVAIHLPTAEIREMLGEGEFIRERKREEVAAAFQVYDRIIERISDSEPKLVEDLADYYSVQVGEIEYLHVARAIAEFIRTKFQIKQTRLHQFVFSDGSLSPEELAGAKIFYGKGKCSACHNGPYFTDLSFHAVPVPQLGFGKNGFGVDYGRYNVTFDPQDLYKFRTPSLFNVTKTAPYGHSGALSELDKAVIAHFDPLTVIDTSKMDSRARTEFYKRLIATGADNLEISNLTEAELEQVVRFLATLEF